MSIFYFVYFQSNIEDGDVEVSVTFIMDGSRDVIEDKKPFSVGVYIDPDIDSDEDKVFSYVPIWPCTHDYINIQVR